MAASVCKALVEIFCPFSDFNLTSRPRLDTIPWVTELAYFVPRGLPIAIAVSPTVNLDESPNSATAVTLSALILTTAISEKVSEPTTSPGTLFPSAKRISACVAPIKTCALVTK